MSNKVTAKVTKNATARVAKKTKSPPGKILRVMTTKERINDMRAFGREQEISKAAALAFLQRAGIVTATGKLTKPFRAS